MGLDVYLKKFEDFESTQQLEASYEEIAERNWQDIQKGRSYEQLTDEEKDSVREKNNALATSMGLDEWGSDSRVEKIEIPSVRYPDHYFKIGYFRSSYNEGGINRILRNTIGLTLESIFNTPDEYLFSPDWKLAKSVAEKAISDFRDYIEKSPYRVSTFGFNEFMGMPDVESEASALAKFLEVKEANKSANCAFSNSSGTFFLDKPLEIAAVLTGTQDSYLGRGKIPCHYVIYKDDMSWYLQALEIVLETIEWVLAQSDSEKYYLAWSS